MAANTDETGDQGWWSRFIAEQAAAPYSDAVADKIIALAECGALIPDELQPAIIKYLNQIQNFAAVWTAAGRSLTDRSATPPPLPDIVAAFDNRLAQFLLRNVVVADPTMEFVLTLARRALLSEVSRRDLSPPALVFCCTLAQQCFLNEYAYWEEPQESVALEILLANIEAMAEDNDPAAVAAIMVASCYRPFSDIPGAPALAAHLESHAACSDFLAQAVHAPAAEKELADGIPALTPIRSDTSRAVQKMYEENPYPRWRLVHKLERRTIHGALQGLFPGADLSTFGETHAPRILIAGCGTGHNIVSFGQAFTGAEISAIDLSRASLAYAKRETARHGLNVRYAQADILELAPLGLQFDIIECGGVLHHTADVEKSWRILAGCLRPGGVMRVGLYNREARDRIDPARNFARAAGYPPTAGGIRRFRHDALEQVRSPGQIPSGLDAMTMTQDFYSVSMCRDLCFHVQEREFSIREACAHVDRVGLTFLGLSLPSAGIAATYVREFPADPSVRHLPNIEAFQRNHRGACGSLYLLLMQKPL